MQQKNNYFMDSKYIDIIYKELSARMTYGLKVQVNDELFTFDKMHMGIGMLYTDYYRQPLESPDIILSGCFYGNDIKPYLFPLSSMTEEQKNEFKLLFDLNYASAYCQEIQIVANMIKWLNKNHFDIYGLIPMGLAIDATSLNIY